MNYKTSPMNHETRCAWGTTDPVYIAYHDLEWGVPTYDDQELFELLILEGAQAGLSWITILKRREGYERAFDGFEVDKVAQYDEEKYEELLHNDEIIRNKSKLKYAIKNARVFQKIQQEFGSFSEYIWGFTDHKIIFNHPLELNEMCCSSPLSQQVSKDLMRRGMRFVGPVIMYSYLQSIGVINDHLQTCYRYTEAVRDLMLSKLKFTLLGYDRLRKLEAFKALSNEAIEAFCITLIAQVEAGEITHKGKNYTIKAPKQGLILTVNDSSFTVITAKAL